jgi:hypothetical protein
MRRKNPTLFKTLNKDAFEKSPPWRGLGWVYLSNPPLPLPRGDLIMISS